MNHFPTITSFAVGSSPNRLLLVGLLVLASAAAIYAMRAGRSTVPIKLGILHSRTGFVDGPEPHQKRHMLRLWLKFPKPWPLSAEFPSHMGYKPAQDTPTLIEAEA